MVPDKEGALSTSPLPSPMEGLDVLLFDRLLWDEWDGPGAPAVASAIRLRLALQGRARPYSALRSLRLR